MAFRSKLFIVVAVVSALIVVPYTRNILVYQVLHRVQPVRRDHGGGNDRTVPGNVDNALVIAKNEGFKARSINAYWRMIERYPNEPALYANMLKYAALWGPLKNTSRPDDDDIRRGATWKPLPDSPELGKVARAVEMGEKLEPDNAFFDCFEAVLLANQGRDSEVLAAVHRAAGKKQFDDHALDELDAVLKDRRERISAPVDWMNPIGRVAAVSVVLFPRYAQIWHMARVVGWHIEQDMKRGERDKALAATIDLVKIGGLMRDKSNVAIGSLVGIAVQDVGVKRAYRGLGGPTLDLDITGAERVSKLQAMVPTGFRPDEWRMLRDDLARSDEFRRRARAYFGQGFPPVFRPVILSGAVMAIAVTMLFLFLLFLLAWGITWAWLAKRGQTGLAGVGPSRLSVWLLCLLPPMAVTAFAALMQILTLFGVPTHMQSWSFGALVTIALALFSPLAVIIIAAARTRIAPDISRFDTFLARLRTGSVFAMQALVALYLLAMIAAIPVTAWTNQAVERMYRNEVQMIWEYQPPAK